MFGTKHNECTGFESRWQVKKVYMETPTQTTEYSSADKGTNTQAKNSTEVQTVSEEHSVKDESDMRRLAEWLDKIYPKVKEQIDDVNNSRAFEDYNLSDDSTDADCKLLQTLNVLEGFNTHGSVDKNIKISNMTWNNTGKSIGITCTYDHKSWCHHSGTVAIYNLDREGKLLDTPRKKLLAESCITSLKFHPGNPAIIAAGTITGNFMVWNIQNDDVDDLIATKNVHDESVTQMCWIYDLDKSILLVTSSTDGLLKLWKFSLSDGLSLKVCFKIKGPILSTVERMVTDKNKQGIVCFDFSKHFPDMFVVCLEGGSIVQCSMSGAAELKGSTTEKPLLNPALKYYEPHQGEIFSVSFSPNRKEMFMTCGTDGEIRIYLIDQEETARVIFVRDVLTDLSFVPYEEKLVVGCGSKGILKIFNIQSGKSIDNVTSENVKNNMLTCLAVNAMKTNIVAVGVENGDIQLWNVPWSLFSMK